MSRVTAIGLSLTIFMCLPSQNLVAQGVFSGGQTGASADDLKATCPAFQSGEYKLVNTLAPQGKLQVSDMFEHESGARCGCTLLKVEKAVARCGPAAPKASSVSRINPSAGN